MNSMMPKEFKEVWHEHKIHGYADAPKPKIANFGDATGSY